MTNALDINLETVVDQATGLLQRGQTAAAIALARESLDRGIEAPLLLNLRAFWLESENRPAEALRDLNRAHELAPSDPMVLNALGLCLAKLSRLEEAADAFQQCARLAPEFAPAHYNCGWSLEELGELDRARDAFLAVVRLNPQSAEPLGRLATLAVRRGRWEEARTFAQKALALAPGHAPAAIALASVDFAAKDYRSARSRLAALVDAPGLTEQDRATVFGLLGDVLDAEKRYGEAFTAYAASNNVFKGAFARRVAASAEMAMDAYVGWLLESFERASMRPWPATAGANEDDGGPAGHVFVLGFPRSGTTLLEEVLACHPDVTTTGERDAFTGIVRDLLARPDQLARLRDLPPGEIRRQRERYWRALEDFGVAVKGRILIDKQPFNTVRLPLIARLFPEARIVFCVRDPRDVVLSCFRRRFVLNAANAEFLTLEGTARLYDMVMRLAALYREKLPLSLHRIRNEDLVADFDRQLQGVCDFAGIGWVEAFRDFAHHSSRRDVATPSAVQILKGLDREGIGHWRNYAAEMAPVLPLLDAWAERLDYPAS